MVQTHKHTHDLMGYANNQGDAKLPTDIQNVFFFNKILTWAFVHSRFLALALALSFFLQPPRLCLSVCLV